MNHRRQDHHGRHGRALESRDGGTGSGVTGIDSLFLGAPETEQVG